MSGDEVLGLGEIRRATYALQRQGSLQFLFRFCLAPMSLGPSNFDSFGLWLCPAIIVLETLNFESFS